MRIQFAFFYARNGVSISHDMQYSTFYVSICCKEIYNKICVNNIKFGAYRLYLWALLYRATLRRENIFKNLHNHGATTTAQKF